MEPPGRHWTNLGLVGLLARMCSDVAGEVLISFVCHGSSGRREREASGHWGGHPREPMTSSERFPKLDSFRPDLPTAGHMGGKRGADGRLRLHQKILDEIENRPRISKRLSIVVQQMAAMGRSTMVKGCSDPVNSGWRRTPLGGHHGMHYYLWWSPQGTRQTRRFSSLQRNSILLRAVRHHDDHSPLNVGRLMDYFPLGLDGPRRRIGELLRNSVDRSPTAVRAGRQACAAGLRLSRIRQDGGPLESRRGAQLGQDAVFVLVPFADRACAGKRFSAFAPPGSAVDARDFGTFLGELCGVDVRRQSLAASRDAFRGAFEWWKISDHYGPWRNRMDALHAELRAVLFGCAVPGMYECDGDGRQTQRRGLLEGRCQLGGAGRRKPRP